MDTLIDRTHEYLFVRQEGFSYPTVAAKLRLHVTEPGSSDFWFDRFKEAVTDWVRTTEEGAAIYDEAAGDLNIGDLLMNDTEFLKAASARLEADGIAKVEMDYVSFDKAMSYDTWLVNGAPD